MIGLNVRQHRIYLMIGTTMAIGMIPATSIAQTVDGPEVDAAQESEIIVTGSRIARKDYSSNTPVVTVAEDALTRTGSTTVDTALKQMPQFVASTGSATNSNGNQGQANIQLRGVGSQRTLVLLDGRRIIPSNSDGTVDINILPSLLIENVEIITGGASAVYGSDAIGGVVNFRMKRKMEGVELFGQAGLSEQGDAASYRLGAAAGLNFGDGRGSSIFSVEYVRRDAITLASRDHTLGANRDTVLPQGTVSFAGGLPSQASVDTVFGRYGAATGAVSRNNAFGFNPDGTLFSTGLAVQNYRGSTNPAQFFVSPTRIQAEGRWARFLQLPIETFTLYNRSSFEVSDALELYAQGFYTHNTGATQLNPLPAPSRAGTGVPLVSANNPFIPADLKALLNTRAAPNAPFALSIRTDALGPRLNEATNKAGQVTLGANGQLGISDWAFNVFGSYGKTSIRVDRSNYLSISGLNSLLNAADGGVSQCAGGFNPFGTISISSSCAAIIGPDTYTTSKVEQTYFEASLQGRLIELPAGDARFAAGLDYRKNKFRASADPRTLSGDIIAAAGSAFSGSTNVKEVYGELLVPLLRDLPLIKKLEADVAFRYSDYNTVGSVFTYKGDLSWQFVGGFTFRGGYERAIRAPSVGELYSPIVNSPTIIGLAGALGSGDPCDINGAYRKGPNGDAVRALCLAQGVPASVIDTYSYGQQSVSGVQGGNRNLNEETADTYSAGMIWRSPIETGLFHNLSVSVDYYKINISDAIGSITGPLVLTRCFNASANANPNYSQNNIFCGRLLRNADGTINQVSAQSLNLASYKTSGFDIQLDWRFKTELLGMPDGGELSLNFLANRLRSFKIQSLVGDPFLDYNGTIGNGQIDPVAISRPKWKSTLYTSYSNGPVMMGLTWRYIGKMSNAANVGNTGAAAGVKAKSYFDLNGRLKINDKFELTGTVANLGDTKPPTYPSQGLSDFSTYDALGRYFSISVKARF